MKINFLKMLLLSTIITPVAVSGQETNPLLRDWNTPHQTPPFAEIKKSDYNPWDIYNTDQAIHRVVDSLFNGPWCKDPNQFRAIFDEIMNKRDEYLVFKDFHEYLKAHQEIDKLYEDEKTWAKMSLNNIAGSGVFSSDRTIEQYNKDIWDLKKLGNLNEN